MPTSHLCPRRRGVDLHAIEARRIGRTPVLKGKIAQVGAVRHGMRMRAQERSEVNGAVGKLEAPAGRVG